MQITAVCPRCNISYQVDESLRGKKMRCPNRICAAVFEVGAPLTQPPAAPPPVIAETTTVSSLLPPAPELPQVGQQSGNVADMVPILGAETVQDTPPKPGQRRPPAPPAKRTPPEAPIPQEPTPAHDLFPDLEFPEESGVVGLEEPPALDWPQTSPRHFTPGTWEAPPVRMPPTDLPEPEPQTNDPVAEEALPETSALPRRRRRPVRLLLTLLLLLSALSGGGYLFFTSRQAGNEADLFQKAELKYQEQDFTDAARFLQILIRDFPSSRDKQKYRMLAELTDLRATAQDAGDDPKTLQNTLQDVENFVSLYQNDPLLKDRQADLWKTLYGLSKKLKDLAEANQEPRLLAPARRAWVEAGKFTPPTNVVLPQVEQEMTKEFTRVGQALAQVTHRREVLAAFKTLADRPSALSIKQAQTLLEKEALHKDPEAAAQINELIKGMVKAHLNLVVYTPVAGLECAPLTPADTLPSLYVAPLLSQTGPGPDTSEVALALVRGVLHALDFRDGSVRWVRRLGVDSAILPQRVPANAFRPELLLVVAADQKALLGLEAATGRVLWHHPLPAPCVGGLVQVDNRVLVPTLFGRIEEVEIEGGRLRGYYQVDQPLVVGGVRQPGTSLVYFPGDSLCIYAVDVARRQLAGILYTGHAPGSLRGLPILTPDGAGSTESQPRGCLVSQFEDQNKTIQRPFSVPFVDPWAKPAAPDLDVTGRAWFPPWHDSQRLAQATDAGWLAAFGIRQKGNRDPLFYPQFGQPFLVESAALPSGRSQLAHADAENYWVAVHGKLHRLQTVVTPAKGPNLVARWPDPPQLGSPLQATQVLARPGMAPVLVLVTQALGQPTSLASAVDADTGRILWQRQLGLVCQGPLAAQGNLVVSPSPKGFTTLDARKTPPSKVALWSAAHSQLSPQHLEKHQSLLTGPEGFYYLSWDDAVPCNLTVAKVPFQDDGKSEKTLRRRLAAPPHGNFSLGGTDLVVPLANGILHRVPMGKEEEDAPSLAGPDWRALGAETTSPGQVTSLGNDEWIFTDGRGGLTRLHWPEPKTWRTIAQGKLAHRIVAPPAHLPGKVGRLAVADAADTVTLFDADGLRPLRSWALSGKITTGPITRQGKFLCIVGKDRLVCLDPDLDVIAWEHPAVAPLIGPPHLAQGMLVLADLSGFIVALDPSTGRPLGAGYQLQAQVAPAASPVLFGPDRLLMPLTDGTLLLIPIEKLR